MAKINSTKEYLEIVIPSPEFLRATVKLPGGVYPIPEILRALILEKLAGTKYMPRINNAKMIKTGVNDDWLFVRFFDKSI